MNRIAENKRKEKVQQRKTCIDRIAALKEYVLSEATRGKIMSNMSLHSGKGDFVVFLSLCNTRERATVVKGIAETLESAWVNAEHNAYEIVAQKTFNVIWARADIVNTTEVIKTLDLNKRIVEYYFRNYFRQGIAFDERFTTAFLEAEVNSNKMITYYTEKQLYYKQIDYDSVILNLTNINNYLRKYYEHSGLKDIPDTITLFTTIGFFCDEDGTVHDLYTGAYDFGRRVVNLVDTEAVKEVIMNASEYLYRILQPDGKFIYGYFPIFNNEIESYNIVRHASTIWSLINRYLITKDDALVPKLNSAIDYLLTTAIVYKTPDIAYVVEKETQEIKLGGNSVVVIMLTEYMDAFNTDKYVELIRHLTNGVLELQDPEKGTFLHVLNYPDYSLKEEMRTVYYDGEAAFALTRAYTFTHDQRYLDRARLAIEYFIAKDYTKHRDHWVAYSLNEITKYIPEPRYYEFALRNVKENLKGIYLRATTYHTYLELLMAGWETYQRLQKSGIKLEYLDKFDSRFFAQTIYKRAFHMLNGYFYPEVAMYMKAPYKIVNSFLVRHHNFRVRIDDIQHYINGYYYYTKYYDSIRACLSDDFISSIHEQSSGNK